MRGSHKHSASAVVQWKGVPSAQALPFVTTGADVATQHTLYTHSLWFLLPALHTAQQHRRARRLHNQYKLVLGQVGTD